jgi:hypothetical protein
MHSSSFQLSTIISTILLFWYNSLVFADIIPSDRIISWSPGVPEGIPNYKVSVNVKDYGAKGNGSSDDSKAFKDAISAAPNYTAVFVPTGTYRLNSEIKITKPIVLRGDGAEKTILIGYSGDADIIELSASNEGENSKITSGYTKGSTTITLVNISGLKTGDYIVVFQDNNSLVDNLGRGWLGVDGDENHCMSQIVKINDINGNTLTINRPLYFSFESGNNPEAKKIVMLEGAGIENLCLYTNSTGNKRYNIFMTQCANCWVRNIESKLADWGHVKLDESYACEIRSSYFHHAHSYKADKAYGVFIFGPNSDHLVEDNIMRACRHSMIFEGGGSGCVFGYNYSESSQGNVGDHFLFADISTHGAHPYMNLFEGNIACHADLDFTHGSDSHNSLFRNHIRGVSTPPDDNIIYGMRCIDIAKNNWYENVVGNVLGTSGQKYNAFEDDGSRTTSSKYIYNFGYSSDGDQSSDDPNSKRTVLRHGNYDYYNNNVQWDSSIADHNIPKSLYLSTKPSFFGVLPWPSIGPDLNPILGALPAKNRYEQGTYINDSTPDVVSTAREIYFEHNNCLLEVSQKEIQYTLLSASPVDISIHDASGKIVQKIVNKKQAAGVYKINLKTGDTFRNGLYLCRMKTSDGLQVKKFYLVR